MTGTLRFQGAIPANLLPFNEDLSFDEVNYRRHLSWLADVDGVDAIVCNGHAAEVSSLNREERRRALAIAADAVGDRVELISGIYTDNTLEAAELAKDARAEGAAGLLVFPPTVFMWGARLRPEMAVVHFETIAEATDLPLIVFEYPPAIGIGYAPETLARLAEIDQVVGVKDWSNDMVALEANLRALRGTGRPVAMLSSYTMSMFGSYVLGADGSISGMGSVTADLHAELFRAVKAGDLDAGRQLNDRLGPLVEVFYAPPFVDMHNRMKEALVMLGRIDKAVVRPPLRRIGDEERERIRGALLRSGLLLP
ncbi:MAG: dihydrodipicolinate synthase family protein [Deltaproteobacteria bacterium]|nr:dihydrodipicolinate synthase family protein [Deltaproteobacteria bacterium]